MSKTDRTKQKKPLLEADTLRLISRTRCKGMSARQLQQRHRRTYSFQEVWDHLYAIASGGQHQLTIQHTKKALSDPFDVVFKIQKAC